MNQTNPDDMNEIPRRAEFLPSVRAPGRLNLQDSIGTIAGGSAGSPLESITKKGEFLPSRAEEASPLKKVAAGGKDVLLGDSIEKKAKADALAAILALDGGGGHSVASHEDTTTEAVAVGGVSFRPSSQTSLSAVPCIENATTASASVGVVGGNEEDVGSETYAYKDYAKLIGAPSGSSAHQSFESGDSESGGGALGFPERLYDLLSHPNHAGDISDVITWQPHGRSWTILKPKEFERAILPKFYSAKCKYTSFIRQANGWGFRRITQGPDRNSYYHELFLRGMPHLIKLMRRPGVSKKLPSDPENEPDFYKINKESPLPLLPHQAPATDTPVPSPTSTQGPALDTMQQAQTEAVGSISGASSVTSASLGVAAGQPSTAIAELLRSHQLRQDAAVATASGAQRQEALLTEVIRSARANQEITALLQSNLHRTGVVRAQEQLQQQQQLRQLQLSGVLGGSTGGAAAPGASLLPISAGAISQGGPALALEAAQQQQRRAEVLRRLSGGIDRRAALLAAASTAAESRARTTSVILPPSDKVAAARRHSVAAVDRHATMMAAASLEASATPALNNTGSVRPSRRYSENPNILRQSSMAAAAAAAAAAVQEEEEAAGQHLRANKLRRLSKNCLDSRAIAAVTAGETARRRRSSGIDQLAANASAVASSLSRNVSASSLASSNPSPAAAFNEQACIERGLPIALTSLVSQGDADAENQHMSAIERRIQNLHSQLHQAMREREAAAAAAGQGGPQAPMMPSICAGGRRAARRVSFQDRSTGLASSATAAEAIGSLLRSRRNQSTEF